MPKYSKWSTRSKRPNPDESSGTGRGSSMVRLLRLGSSAYILRVVRGVSLTTYDYAPAILGFRVRGFHRWQIDDGFADTVRPSVGLPLAEGGAVMRASQNWW